MYDKYACWCETTTARKASDIHQGMADIKSLGSKILSLKGKVATLSSEISELSKAISDNQQAQDTATGIRQKENGEYMSEKAEMEQTLDALEKAITVLSGAGTKTALLQMSRPRDAFKVLNAASVVHEAVARLPVNHNLSGEQISLLAEFTADPAEYYDQKAEKSASYSPASATIQGILKDMYDTFSMNLEKNTENEASQQKNYESVMAVKAKEMATCTATRTKKEGEKAAAEKELADAQQDLDDTQKQMKAYTELFDTTKKICTSKAAEWNERVRARTEELSGINKALEILTSDDARALFNKAIKPGKETSFLQINSMESSPRFRAYETLKQHATQAKSLRLAAVAATVKASGHFDTVIAAVDKMIEDLRKEAKDDRDRKDWCKEETFKNEQEASRYEYKIEKLDGKLGKLTGQLEEMQSTLATTVASIQATMEDIEKMEDARKEAHATFESKKADDEGAVQLLAAAIESMSAFYKNNKIDIGPVQGSINFLQRRAPVFEVSPDQAPDASFSSAGKSSGASKGIISTMTMIKEDCEDEIKNGEKEDVEAQVEFEEQMTAAKNLVADLTAKKTNLESSISATNDEIDSTNVEKGDNAESLTAENEYLWSIKPDCTWLLTTFDDRRKKREIEIDGLQESKGMRQGAGAEGLIQKHTGFDDDSFGRLRLERMG